MSLPEWTILRIGSLMKYAYESIPKRTFAFTCFILVLVLYTIILIKF